MIWHILALVTACIWGSTFAASSILISAGLSPAEIMILRFLLAYILMLPFSHKRMWPKSWRDEVLFLCAGIAGGSLYFLSENYAIKLTNFTSTVALIVCTCPILTALLHRAIWHDSHLSAKFIIGSATALLGVSMVVLNGVFVLDDNPWVILLSACAALFWSAYSNILNVLDRRYTSDIITRKVFFWGIVTMLPVCISDIVHGQSNLIQASATNWQLLANPEVVTTLFFLSVIASLGCFLTWNIVCKRLTVVTASNYLYFNPVTSLWMGAILLGERVTWPAIVGCAVTIAGVYLCNKRETSPKETKIQHI